jgi:ATP dependent DNA ligase domain
LPNKWGCYSRPGNDLTDRFPLIVETLSRLRLRSCIIDGEEVACDGDGVTLFNRVRYRRHDESIFLYAFDLIELNGDDLRRDPLEGRNGFKSVKSAPSRRCCECATEVACQGPRGERPIGSAISSSAFRAMR